MNNDWQHVTKSHPCPICHKPDWCTVSMDGSVACCMRVHSLKRLRNDGWLHRLKDDPPYRPAYRPPLKPTLKTDFSAKWHAWLLDTKPQQLESFARQLGIPAPALAALDAAWAWQHSAWAFPMRDGAGAVAGIRLRSESGRKWAVPGSRQGVFVPASPSADGPDIALICEGPTDTAAALSLGYLAIGRPCCLGCEMALIETCRRRSIRRVVIVADNDGPGLEGARKLASSIRCPHKTIIPPAKDFRDWVRAGATKALVDCVINQQIWRFP